MLRARFAPVLWFVAPLLTAVPAHAVSLTASGLSFPAALPGYGESLELVGRLGVAASDAPFPMNQATHEYTWTLQGPVVHAIHDPAPGIRYRNLTFGVLEIREDPARDSEFLENPPNVIVPSSFHDGEILLMATVVNLQLREVFGIVTARADLRFEGGAQLDAIGQRDWTLNAAVSVYGEGIPSGYGSHWTLDLVPQQAVSVDARSWGGVKALYR